jgi:transcription initiation factor TFIIB
MTSEKTDDVDSFSVEECPECGASILMHDQENAEVVCTNCGFVVAMKIADRGPEWRVFTPEQQNNRARVGAPYTFSMHDKGLSTKIDWRDIRGSSPENRAQLHRLRRWQRRSRVSSATERKLASVLSEMHRIAAPLNLPKNVLETATLIYRTAIKKHLTRGKPTQGIVAAAIYLACRRCRLMRTLEELSRASGINKLKVARNYRFLVKKLNYFVPPVRRSQHVMRLSNQLGLSGKVEGVAHEILKAAEGLKLTSGRGVKSVAAAASYIACKILGEYRTQREFAEAANITEVTIRNRYKEIMERLLIIISL